MLWDKLSSSSENDYIDFKRQWYSGPSATFDMFHDILSMCNSLTDSNDRFIIIGISEDKKTQHKTIFDVSNDENHKTAENIIQDLRNYMPVPPSIEIIREEIEGKSIDIIKISPTLRELPYTLRKNFSYQDIKKKTHTLPKDWIYSRDGSRNTGINELCHKSVLEELFARKRGEHLPAQERFALYLNDFTNWKRPKTSGTFEFEDISEDNYFYKLNHKFKIVRHDLEDSHKRMQKKEDVLCYSWLVADTGICENYWNYRIQKKACYDDYYSWFDIELWVDNTLIEALQIMEFYFKYYFHDNDLNLPCHFYLPPENYLAINGLKTKADTQNSFIWKICKMLTYQECVPDCPYNSLDNLLDLINWKYLNNFIEYEKTHKDYMYKESE